MFSNPVRSCPLVPLGQRISPCRSRGVLAPFSQFTEGKYSSTSAYRDSGNVSCPQVSQSTHPHVTHAIFSQVTWSQMKFSLSQKSSHPHVTSAILSQVTWSQRDFSLSQTTTDMSHPSVSRHSRSEGSSSNSIWYMSHMHG